MAGSYNDLIRRIHIAGEAFAKILEPLANAISQAIPALAQMQPHFEAIARANKIIDSISETGWLPYHALDIDFIEEGIVGTVPLESLITEYYEKNWVGIRRDFEARMASYRIS